MKAIFSLVATLAACFGLTAADQPPVPLPVPPVAPPPAVQPGPTVALPAPVPATNAASPKITFSEMVHDFGTVNAGDVKRCDFVFTNTGKALLEVSEVRPTCGCTTAGAWTRQVEPGATGTIPLQLNTANFQGPVVKFVSVVCNDPTQPMLQLQLKGNIWKPVDVTPNFVMFNLNSESQTGEVRVVKIVNNTPVPIEVTDPQSGNAAFRATLKTVEAGKVFELQVYPNLPFTPGTVQTTITAKTTSTNLPTLSVTALAITQPPVVALPSQVYLPPGPLPNATPVTVLIQNNSSDAVTLPDAKISADNVPMQVRETAPGKTWNISLTFPQGFELSQGRPATLTVTTSHPRVPTISIPVIQPPRPAQVMQPPTQVVPPPPPSLRAPPTLPSVPPMPPPMAPASAANPTGPTPLRPPATLPPAPPSPPGS